MNKLSIFIIMFIVFSLILTPIAFAMTVEIPVEDPPTGDDNQDPPEIIKGNNGFGNGDQDAPGNSGDHNNAENARPSRKYPGNSEP